MPDIAIASALDGERTVAQRQRIASAEYLHRKALAAGCTPGTMAYMVEQMRAELDWQKAAYTKGTHCEMYDGPHWSEGYRLTHERAAAVAVNWWTHLRVEEQEIAKSIGMGMMRSSRPYLRALFARRLKLKRGFKAALAAYRAARVSVDSSALQYPEGGL